MFGLISSQLINKRLSHGFFTRKGPFLRAQSDTEHNMEEQDMIHKWFGVLPNQIITCNQVHGGDVCVISKNPAGENFDSMDADALITNQPGVPIGVRSADCVPILLADCQNGIVGAIHAGWRGTVAGVIENTVAAMVKLGADIHHISCAIGPCISQKSYEVGLDLYDQIPHKQFFIPKTPDPTSVIDPFNDLLVDDMVSKDQTWLFDLPGYIAFKLGQLGIKTIDSSPVDTFAARDLFYSYRRHRLNPEDGYQSQLSIIMLTV